MTHVTFSELRRSDLVVDAIYESDANSRSVAGEPLAPLTGTGNQGGFRFSGSIASPEIVVLYTTMAEPDWPDSIDEEMVSFSIMVIIVGRVSSFMIGKQVEEETKSCGTFLPFLIAVRRAARRFLRS